MGAITPAEARAAPVVRKNALRFMSVMLSSRWCGWRRFHSGSARR